MLFVWAIGDRYEVFNCDMRVLKLRAGHHGNKNMNQGIAFSWNQACLSEKDTSLNGLE